ncbi:daunorubicin resistance ABC transporter ATP-binding subunit [Archaeoglobus sulfaticallidus PM70-1]|uniref:Daunorubicin resistance ABC transporter ATP-binding subunit n=1 Tax=Archaeoglobus sulfaticallidus PM70-1 TaxID=387631 RepID=N0BMM2_9EURY|nr:daunorubicin resistance protein DrrA family ABC transporter ATP-binding protein [Archaeoglobus sulfaticallidus]AGK61876.1 daunorubicin resistance ABC transporter ATP-binding subunit [Archaeoglobus sulfaticallidus PM70-1]
MDDIIVVDSIGKRFGNLYALKGVSFRVERGEIFGLLGPNGAGKTTLIKILSTLLKPSEGKAFVAGYSITDEPSRVRQNIGIVFQEPTLDLELTARENLDFHGRIYGMDGQLRKERIDEVLSLVGLLDKADELVKKFSGGMQRRLEIARGLMHSPQVLFLDEPTLGLDVQTRRNIWEYIESMENVTIILTTHYIEEAERLCDRVAIIDHGRIIALDTVESLRSLVGRDSIEVYTRDGEKLIAALAEYDESVFKTDYGVLISANEGEKLIPKIVTLANENGVAINSISLKKSSLEDVFIRLTGRTIRGGGSDISRFVIARRR